MAAFHSDLLEQAEHLAKRERSRPKQASLRRAVSTAYYALFHLLISEAVGNWRRPEQRASLARSFDHGRMKTAYREERARITAGMSTHPDPARANALLGLATTFLDMQEQRHAADYDSAVTWTRTDVLGKIRAVKAAFVGWASIRDEQEAQDFLLSLFVRKR